MPFFFNETAPTEKQKEPARIFTSPVVLKYYLLGSAHTGGTAPDCPIIMHRPPPKISSGNWMFVRANARTNIQFPDFLSRPQSGPYPEIGILQQLFECGH